MGPTRALEEEYVPEWDGPAVLAASPDRPLCPPLRAFRRAAVNRRTGPGADIVHPCWQTPFRHARKGCSFIRELPVEPCKGREHEFAAAGFPFRGDIGSGGSDARLGAGRGARSWAS
jgi:hypothetical protein